MFIKLLKTTLSGLVFLTILISPSMAQDYSERLEQADKSLILQNYQTAERQYKKIIHDENSPVVKAYIHYRLGEIYERKQKSLLARQEWQKGLSSLENSGENKHPLNTFLLKAMAEAE